MYNYVTEKISVTKMTVILLATIVSLSIVFGVIDASIANAAFENINIGGKTVADATKLDEGLFKDMNVVLMIFLSIAGFVVIACLIFAGVKLATSQGNPQGRTQGFIGLGMALLGGWVVYKALDLAGWIKGISSSE